MGAINLFSARTLGVYPAAQYGARGDGATDDTAAIQAAIDAAQSAGGGIVWLDTGTYKLSATAGYALRVSGQYVEIRGSGKGTILAMSSAAGDTLQFYDGGDGSAYGAALGCSVRDLAFRPSVSRTSGSELVCLSCWAFTAQGLLFQGSGFTTNTPESLSRCDIYRAIQVGPTTAWPSQAHYYQAYGYLQDITIDHARNAIWLANAVDWWIGNLSTWAAYGPDDCTGVAIEAGCQSVNISNADVVGPSTSTATGYALKLDNAFFPSGRRTAFNKFVGCYFDSFGSGLYAGAAQANSFTDTWFSNRPGTGVNLTADSVAHEFTACQFYNCGTHGATVNGAGHSFVNCIAAANGASSTGDGIALGGSASGIRLVGNRCWTGSGTQITSSQRYGVSIDASASSIAYVGNDTRGNATGGVYNPGSVTLTTNL